MRFEITRPLEQLRTDAKMRINAHAGAIITARLPLFKQQNLTARAVELQAIGSANWTQDQAAEWQALQGEWDWVKSIRAASNAATTAVDAAIDSAGIYDAEKQFVISL